MSESTEIAMLPPALSPAVVFAPGGVEDVLAQIRAKVADVPKDISTPENREAIRKAAYAVARSKTALDEMGKELTAELKAKTGAIDAERRKIREQLDELKDQVRKPLTDWEEAEKGRVAAHEEAIQEVRVLALMDATRATVEEIDAQLAVLETYAKREWEEFRVRFDGHYVHVKETLEGFREVIVQREAEKAELGRLRAEEEARRQKEREEQIAREAAEKARREAEEAAAKAAREQAEREEAERRRIQAEADARERAEREAREKVEREKREAEERAAKAEADAKAASEKVEAERIERHQRVLSGIRGLSADACSPFNDSALIRHIMGLFENMEELRRDWEEFAGEADATIAKCRSNMADRLAEALANEEKAAKERETEAAERAEREKQAAIEAERKRVAEQQAKEKAEAEAREKDKKHKAKINNDAVAALTKEAAISDDTAKAVITAIAKGLIPNVRISY